MIYTFEHRKIRKCNDCPMLRDFGFYDGECQISGLLLNLGDIMEEKPSWCPLIEEKKKRTTKKKGAKRA
ncbi:MAG: hypothetical protein Q4A78_08720 [Peptostreptococcaceae bacterium]|nr:hypothetical protein [Peptostreptococcaceae bacterium]